MIKQIKQFGSKIWEKTCQFGRWCKKKVIEIAVVLGIIGIATAATVIAPPIIPSVIAEGEVIEFSYTDENVGETFIIRTNKEIYTPLWAWNGFDVYLMVSNESGKTQQVDVSPFFSKDFTIESIAILDPSATTIIKVPVYEEVCNATSTECWNEKIGEEDKEVMGKWNDISNPTFFSEEDYQQFISDNNIPIKDKGGRKAKQKFGALFLKNKTVYFKVRLIANEPFSIEEFDLEIIGDKGGYGLLDPTILTDDFNSYNDGDLSGQGDWSGDNNFDVQTATAGNPEGEGVGKEIFFTGDSGERNIRKTGDSVNDGRITVYLMRTTNSSGEFRFNLREIGVGSYIRIKFKDDGHIYMWVSGGDFDIQTYNVDQWYQVEIEWESTSYTHRVRIDEGTWTDWKNQFLPNHTPSGIEVQVVGQGSGTSYFDYIAEEPYAEAGTNMQLNILDAWKVVELMKINIADSWQDVMGVQVNIGDSWEVVY